MEYTKAQLMALPADQRNKVQSALAKKGMTQFALFMLAKWTLIILLNRALRKWLESAAK